MNGRTGRAFTLIELLVVIAIIAILAAILFPVFAQAREKARETTCVSDARQVGLQVRMYVQDFDEVMPIFYAYNNSPGPGQPGHKGIEVEILPYGKNKDIFRCPDDQGSPYMKSVDCPGASTYQQCYGSSYRFDAGSYCIVVGESSQNNVVYSDPSTARTVTDATFVAPAETRIMRDEEFPFFSQPVYGYYSSDPAWNFYQQWHPRGGTVIFADGHARFVVSSADFDNQIVCAPGGRSAEVNPATGSIYYWGCD